MFCPSCGAKNSDDARFCNMCGTALVAPTANTTMRGAGPRPATSDRSAQQMGSAAHTPSSGPRGDASQWEEPGVSSMSLSAIGVQSTGRVWATIAGGAAVLLALGALGGWLVTRGSGGDAEVPPDTIAAPMEIGLPTAVEEHAPTAVPEPGGEAPPEPGPAERGGRAAPSRTNGAARSAGTPRGDTAPQTERGATVRDGTTGGTGAARDAVPTGGADTVAAPAGGGRRETNAATGGASGGATVVEQPASTEGTAGDSAPADPAAGEEERDLMLDLYATRVRRYIRSYYAGPAQSCFDRAARVNDGLRGTVLVTFTIKAEGGTENARVTRNTTGDEVLGNCLVNQVNAWDLPGPPGGAIELAMPFSR
jgi:TonB family protein